ncbi:MAG: RIO1 family regulatory kinase/ATPase [Thermoplasmata archaeon]
MPNTPYLDKSVRWRIETGNLGFHEPGYREVADAILDAGLATEVLQRIGSGKEADVYLCLDGRRRLAVKSYRLYRSNHRGGRPIKLEAMGQQASREYELLVYAWRGRVRVPEPGRRVENMLSMQFLGTLEGPAPRMHEVVPSDPGQLAAETLEEIERLAEAGIVHSDLSPFNILVEGDHPWIIDLAAGVRVDRLGTSPWVRLEEASIALRRGMGAIARYFRKHGEELDVEGFVQGLVTKLDRFGVRG